MSSFLVHQKEADALLYSLITQTNPNRRESAKGVAYETLP